MWMTAKERADAAFIQPHQQRLARNVIKEDRAAVLERLEAYTDHTAACRLRFQPEKGCTCGLDATIAEILERPNETR